MCITNLNLSLPVYTLKQLLYEEQTPLFLSIQEINNFLLK